MLREGSDDYVEKYYSCIVDPEGNVIGDPDINEKSVFEYAENKQSSVIATYNDYVMNKAGGWVFQYDQWYYSYDITDPDNPKLCIVFWPGGSSAMYLMNQYSHDQSSSNYRIEINPSNGTVLNDVVIRLPYSKELSWLVNRY